MRKVIITLSLLAGCSMASFAQQIVNGGFEVWEQRTGFWNSDQGDTYYEYPRTPANYVAAATAAGLPRPNDADLSASSYFLRTLNNLAEINPGGGTPPVQPTCLRSTDAFLGQYAARVVSITTILGGNDLFIPGVLATVEVDFVNATAETLTMPYSSRPDGLKGAMKYVPVGQDSAEISVQLFKSQQLIGSGSQKWKAAVSDWTEFNIPITYTSDVQPDSITVFFVSSAGYDFNNLYNCVGEVGSTLYIDEIEFTGNIVPISKNSAALNVTVSPNPASEVAVFTFEDFFAGSLEIIDLQGRVWKHIVVDSQELSVSVSDMPSGNYIYKIVSSDKKVTTGKLMVVK